MMELKVCATMPAPSSPFYVYECQYTKEVNISSLPACKSIASVCNAFGGQKRVLDPRELEMVESPHVDAN